MRQLIACPDCRRQYDAAGRKPEERLHCSCGGVLSVPEESGHDSGVVRCSACGAPRHGSELDCGYCRASFTLHERDLNTICPGCATRVSDRARFCHHCGIAIVPEVEAGGETEEDCPACGEGRRLRSRELEEAQLSVLECGRCAGLWVGRDVFRRLEEKAVMRSVPPQLAAAQSETVASPIAAGGSAAYRPCVVCSKLMHRQNYGRRSGVIVDLCKPHGVWFDDQELARILSWIRDGGLEQARARNAEEERQRLREARRQARSGGGGGVGVGGAWMASSSSSSRIGGGHFLLELGGFLFDLFDRR